MSWCTFSIENAKFWPFLAYFDYFYMFYIFTGYFAANLHTFWCTLYRPKYCGGVPKLTNMWYASYLHKPDTTHGKGIHRSRECSHKMQICQQQCGARQCAQPMCHSQHTDVCHFYRAPSLHISVPSIAKCSLHKHNHSTAKNTFMHPQTQVSFRM